MLMVLPKLRVHGRTEGNRGFYYFVVYLDFLGQRMVIGYKKQLNSKWRLNNELWEYELVNVTNLVLLLCMCCTYGRRICLQGHIRL